MLESKGSPRESHRGTVYELSSYTRERLEDRRKFPFLNKTFPDSFALSWGVYKLCVCIASYSWHRHCFLKVIGLYTSFCSLSVSSLGLSFNLSLFFIPVFICTYVWRNESSIILLTFPSGCLISIWNGNKIMERKKPGFGSFHYYAATAAATAGCRIGRRQNEKMLQLFRAMEETAGY